MSKLAQLLILQLVLWQAAKAQSSYWQQEVNYNINVTLNDNNNSIKGNLSLEYINHSPDTLTFIWFHLFPNAYKNAETALAKQLAESEDGKKKLVNIGKGYIDSLQFTVNGQLAQTSVGDNIDILKLILPKPLLPGDKVSIATPFFVQLPPYFSRSGYDGQQYMVCQWYPKPAVYDRKGWHQFPYLDQGEFYSEYGSFKVSVTLPTDYVVGATGLLQVKEELDAYKKIGLQNNQDPSKPVLYKAAKKGVKTLSWYGEKIHDFAWFASKEFVIRYDTLQLPGHTVDVFSYGQLKGNNEWKKSTSFIKDAVSHYSGWIGEYPYPVVQAVEGPKNLSSGGMEYPMITLITSPDANEERMDAVITHEVGHNWFYGILGSNERDHPWMDEGVNTYYQFRYEGEKYRDNSIFGGNIPKELKNLSAADFLARIYGALNSIPAAKPVSTSSTGFPNKDDYGIVVYVKTAVWLYIIENSIGRDVLDKGVQTYFNEWKFKHPYPEDFKAALEKANGSSLDKLFELLNKEGNF
ncbi:MAG: M1 family metallopeptidase [Chitinophagaceae bacterium]